MAAAAGVIQSAFQGIGFAEETGARDALATACVDLLPLAVDVVGPQALEPRDDGETLIFISDRREARHDTPEADAPIGDRIVENSERVVPGVRSPVQWRRRINAVCVRRAPFGGRTAIGCVADSAVRRI